MIQMLTDLCRIPPSLSWMSHRALHEYAAGLITDTGFIYYFSRASSDLIPVAECVVQALKGGLS